MKKFLALARVSSREQQREGFSLQVQIDAFHDWAHRHGGVVAHLFEIAETASRRQQRKIFREAMTHAKQNADKYDGLLFYKVDRAVRNMPDWIDLEKLASDYDVPLIFVTLPSQDTPNGRLMVRTLAAVATYQTEQQSVDVREGINRRVRDGLFPSQAPYGYRNFRDADKRSRIYVDDTEARAVRRAFGLRANQHLTVEQIIQRLYDEGMVYSDSNPKFPPSKMHHILKDRSYIGEIFFRGNWHPGTHRRLVDRQTWDDVQATFDDQRPRARKFAFGNELIRCGHCNLFIVGERKTKQTQRGPKDYIYYRCGRYSAPSHPRVRPKEKDFQDQAAQFLSTLRLPSPEWIDWSKSVATDYLRSTAGNIAADLEELRRQRSLLATKRDTLLDLRLASQVNDHVFESKGLELQKRESLLAERAEALEESSEQIEQKAQTAACLFDTIRQRWVSWDADTQNLVLRLLFGGFELQGDKLVQVQRTPIELFQQSPS